ncbi:hypothetical protein SAMN05216251_12827 [Actinacidiphila alni]|uniref:Uncharacterized protein n=1 Tax=Actinacidiphila alni TaxID=380248 RepID=A0A1I2LEQ3_9ACTN|nr:hypothetical protein [Actinacidiphila alni]SFF77018.1 hypothetical protein SAMN05216251_12827 [Actinacidiphila alni]
MDAEFLGVAPASPSDEPPTVWRDTSNGDLIVEYADADPAARTAGAERPAPGHTPGIPDGETVVRLPADALPAVRDPQDDADDPDDAQSTP